MIAIPHLHPEAGIWPERYQIANGSQFLPQLVSTAFSQSLLLQTGICQAGIGGYASGCRYLYTTAANNPARDYHHFTATPVTGSLGADVTDIDLNQLSEEGQAELRRALMDHQVLFIRDQQLSLDQFEAVTQRFGEFGKEPYVK